MAHVDALSRAPTEDSTGIEAEVMEGLLEVLLVVSEEENVMAMQRADTKLGALMKILSCEELERSTSEQQRVKGYS